jgi:hypothetical protein
MAINKTLTEFFGDGAVQTLTELTLAKASFRSRRTPIGFLALVATENNTAEGLFLAILLMAWENQDTSQDSELVIGGPNIDLVNIVKDGVAAIGDRYVFEVIITAPRPTFNTLPNPNNV